MSETNIEHQKGPAPAALVAALAAVESACFERPWGPLELAEALEQPGTAVAYLGSAQASAEPLKPALVAAYCLHRQVLDELEILQLATHPSHQRQGLARRLIGEVLGCAGRSNCAAAFLEVRRSNIAALALYQGAGFRVCGLRRGYYAPSRSAPQPRLEPQAEDALLLRCDLPLAQKTR